MLAGSQPGLSYAAPLMSGDAGTEQTINVLRGLVDDAWKDPYVNRAAIEIIRNSGVQPYDSWGQIRAIYNFAHSFYFVNDPVSKETLRPTRELLKLMAGDCDDINGNVIPALLGSIGYETRWVTIAADSQMPENFSHIYAEVYNDGAWYPLDAARPDAAFGLAPANYYRREWWSITDGSHGDYAERTGNLSGGRRGFRGLGDATTSAIQIGLNDVSSMVQAVNGQLVQPALQMAIGPGGAMMTSPTPPPASDNSNTILLLILAGLIAWSVIG